MLAILPTLSIAALLAAPGRGEPHPEAKRDQLLAVMDIVNNTGEFASFVEGMPDMLITELMESGEIKLVERTKVQTAMKALKLETSGLTEERNLELGKWLGVDGILFGTFNRLGEKYRLDVRAIDVQTGKIKVAASATCGRNDVLDLVPVIGGQLRMKLAAASPGRSAPLKPPPPPAPQSDSCRLLVQYKMMVSLFSEGSIPHQRVRVYLDNRLVHTSGVVNGLNRYFPLYHGNIPAGTHTLTLVHGVVDKQGRWLRELDNQPRPFAFQARKDDTPSIRYRMHAHDRWFSFKDFDLSYNTLQGE